MSMPHDATELHPKGMLGRLRMNVRTALVSTGVGFALAFAGIAFAQAPAGSTGECKDGSYTTNATKRGACSGHKGVKEWYGSKGESQAEKAPKAARTTKAEKAAAEKSAAEATAPSKSSRAAGAGAMGAAGAPSTMSAAPSTSMAASNASKNSAMRTTAAAGGGAGKVWVNTSSNVYHCMNDEWYGKTKQGEYMSEADAKAKGAHAARGKACS
ncbi:MAG TPA: DUF3761 domain-containing protein [Casimicrobiaceae bacterium]|nr:DUF3761 domain-containing protein [Casimicrobiaceae bacterium]